MKPLCQAVFIFAKYLNYFYQIKHFSAHLSNCDDESFNGAICNNNSIFTAILSESLPIQKLSISCETRSTFKSNHMEARHNHGKLTLVTS